MSGWFRKGLSPHHTALAMIGAKAGNDVVVVGAGDVDLAAELGRVTGLNGQTAVCDDNADAREQVNAAAAREGVLVDFLQTADGALPFDPASKDIVVLALGLARLADERRPFAVHEALRVLRPGGRVIVIEGTRRTGWLSGLRKAPPRLTADDVFALLDRAGTKARRQLADVDGVAFHEARKASS